MSKKMKKKLEKDLKYNEREYPCTLKQKCCLLCRCFEIDEPYMKDKIIIECQFRVLTLYELAGCAVDKMKLPEAFSWSVDDVAKWMGAKVAFPQYMAAMEVNMINGRRLLLLENATYLPMININKFEHMKKIIYEIRQLYGFEFVEFARSIGLTSRRLWTLITRFKSRTGPKWGFIDCTTKDVKALTNSSDVLRLHKIIEAAPVKRNHWDLVWYAKPKYPKMMLGKMLRGMPPKPTYPSTDLCQEYKIKRKFRVMELPEKHQYLWTQHRPIRTQEDVLKAELESYTYPQIKEASGYGMWACPCLPSWRFFIRARSVGPRQQQRVKRRAWREMMRLRETRYRAGTLKINALRRRNRTALRYDIETGGKLDPEFECYLKLKYPDTYLSPTMEKLVLVDERKIFDEQRTKATPCEF